MLSSTVSSDCDSQRSKLNAFSTYTTCSLLNVYDLLGTVNACSDSLQLRNVYISGLPSHLSSGDFRALCQRYGLVEASKLCVDGRKKYRQGYGFALFYTNESAAACIRGLNNALLCGRCLQARYADPCATPRATDGGLGLPLHYVMLPFYDVALDSSSLSAMPLGSTVAGSREGAGDLPIQYFSNIG